jgi:transposase
MHKKKLPILLTNLQNIINTKKQSINIPQYKNPIIINNKEINYNFTYEKSIGSDIDCFIQNYNGIITNPNNKLQYEKLKYTKDTLLKTIKYTLYPTNKQKNILINYCDAHIEMYNNVVKLIKDKRKEEIQLQENINIRYCDMKYKPNITIIKKLLINEKKYLIDKYNVNSHILDYAIVDCIAMLKSIISNQKAGNIKNSKLRFIKKSKNKKIFKVEKHICSSNSFCSSILGKNLNIIPNLNFQEECKTVYIIQYNKLTDTFLLLRRIPIKPITLKNPNKVISIDPGENTLITGISENHVIEIGTNIKEKISKYLNKIIKIKKYKGIKKEKILPNGDTITENIIVKKVKRQIKKIQTKIDNYIIDTQWKVANYLTLNYDHILIGNLSTSNMKKQKKVNNLDILKNLNMYKLREKIKYKCLIRNKKYLKVNEAYTTKCCINCSHVNDIGTSREYKCSKCKKKYGRDIKAAGCIYLKALL